MDNLIQHQSLHPLGTMSHYPHIVKINPRITSGGELENIPEKIVMCIRSGS